MTLTHLTALRLAACALSTAAPAAAPGRPVVVVDR
jgi:hypothetical protein